jgi:hypothetical protein
MQRVKLLFVVFVVVYFFVFFYLYMHIAVVYCLQTGVGDGKRQAKTEIHVI